MQNHLLNGLANTSIKNIMRRLTNQATNIFGEFNDIDYQNLSEVFARLRRDANVLSEYDVEDLQEFIDYGVQTIAQNYQMGRAIHPGTLNVLIMAIDAFNQASRNPYNFVVFHADMPHQNDQVYFMNEVVRPAAQNMQLFALHHAPWMNPEHQRREDERRAREEAPGAETRIARTLSAFRAMGGDQMDEACPICFEEFIEQPENLQHSRGMRRSPVFMPVVFHKDEKGKWFHPMHTTCVRNTKKQECPTCREKVIWPRMNATRRTRRPNSAPHSVRRSSKNHRRSSRRSPNARQSPLQRRSADY